MTDVVQTVGGHDGIGEAFGESLVGDGEPLVVRTGQSSQFSAETHVTGKRQTGGETIGKSILLFEDGKEQARIESATDTQQERRA